MLTDSSHSCYSKDITRAIVLDGTPMIQVTLFDGNTCWLNPDHILMLESRPDTHIRLTTGEKWLVKESIEELQSRFLAFKQTIYALHPKPQMTVVDTP